MKRPYKQGPIALIILMAGVVLVSLFALAVNTKTAIAQQNQKALAVTQDYGLKDTAKAAGLPIGEADPVLVAATIINVVLGLVGVLAVILIIYGGFSWMTAGGSEEKITTAKKVLSGAIIGLIIIMGSFIISSFIVKNLKTVTSLGTNDQTKPKPQTCAELKGTCVNPRTQGSCSPTQKLFPTSDCASPTDACCYPNP